MSENYDSYHSPSHRFKLVKIFKNGKYLNFPLCQAKFGGREGGTPCLPTNIPAEALPEDARIIFFRPCKLFFISQETLGLTVDYILYFWRYIHYIVQRLRAPLDLRCLYLDVDGCKRMYLGNF